MMKNAFYFILKTLFVLKIINFFFFYFSVMQKRRLDYKDKANFRIFDFTTLVNKQLKYIYCPVSHEVKVTRQ